MLIRDRGFATPCWVSDMDLDDDGYSRIWTDHRPRFAHRVTYEHYVGPVPEGLELDHLCRVRNCVNPAHLEPVTHLLNVRRGARHSPASLS